MKSQSRHSLFAVGLVLVLFIINWVNNDTQTLAPELSFIDIDGVQHELAQYQGKPILLTFWATDCPGCIQEMPELIKLHQEFSSQGLTMIAVAMAHDTPKHIKAMRAHKKLPYLITWDNKADIARAFDNVRVTPTHFLIAPNGEIVMRKIGGLNLNRLHEKLYNMGLSPE
ncbi:antioxidant AhpC [Methylophaga sp. 42_25_T18]|nr:antioxidant AhpC [Methylophaga sp. 42_25_T18]OUR89783.1 antioxidant AhpC [Methylophaga sp. 42_8_T64]